MMAAGGWQGATPRKPGRFPWGKPRRQRSLAVLLTVGCLVAAATALLACGIVINETPNLPLGFYRKQPGRPVEKGCFILFELPAAETAARPYARGQLIKQVVAAGGDRVSIGPRGVLVNGAPLENSAQLEADLYGQALPRPVLQNYVLPSGEILALSTHHPRSFDRRYFGPLPRGRAAVVVVPVWTWGGVGR